MAYVGRFAPSPTGPLHAGSLAAALASWLDARAAGGKWLLRIEDIDPPREVPGATAGIVDALMQLGLEWDGPISYQSRREQRYLDAFERLRRSGHVYGCRCTRAEVDAVIAARPGWPAGVYPGTCADAGLTADAARAWRLRVGREPIAFDDRGYGRIEQDLARAVGDFVVRRADQLWAYQLAVVVDDAEQGVTDIVRGADLLDNTPRQIALQRALGFPLPRYLHVPLVVNERGEKLSKQTGARALDLAAPLMELQSAARHLGLPVIEADNVSGFLDHAIAAWRVCAPLYRPPAASR